MQKVAKRNKLIYINTRAYGRALYPQYSNDYFLFGVGQFIGRQILKGECNVDIENWRCDKTVKKSVTKRIDGITCRVFPACYTKKFGEFSVEFLYSLRAELNNHNSVLHFMGLHNNFFSLIASFAYKYPLVATHLGCGHFRFKYEQTRNPFSLLRDIAERRILRNLDYAFVQTSAEKDYLRCFLTDKSISHGAIYGIDFDIFRRIPKNKARRMLGLPQDRKILLSVGRAYQNKGTTYVLDAFAALKESGVILYMLDIQSSDPLYSEVVQSGALFKGYVDQYLLPVYYSAADLLVYLPFDSDALDFAGPGYVNLESLACGTPVVSTLLKHLPDPEITTVSRIPRNPEEIVPMIKDILANPPHPDACRRLVYKHYNWCTITARHTKIYHELFRRYYDSEVELGHKHLEAGETS